MTGWWTKSGVRYREASGKPNGRLVGEAPPNHTLQRPRLAVLARPLSVSIESGILWPRSYVGLGGGYSRADRDLGRRGLRATRAERQSRHTIGRPGTGTRYTIAPCVKHCYEAYGSWGGPRARTSGLSHAMRRGS